MSSDDNAAIARSWAQATFIEHDLDAAAQLVAPDWIGHWTGVGEEHSAWLAPTCGHFPICKSRPTMP